MASTTLISVTEYLASSYRPDRDYVDGDVLERNLGEYEHSNLQGAILVWFRSRQGEWKIRVLPEQRIRVSNTRFRIPDVCVIRRDAAIEPVFTRPPLICIEVLSKDDTLRSMQERVNDYLDFGVPHIWILDPAHRLAYVCTREGFLEPGDRILAVPDSPICVPLDELFRDLD